MDVLSIIGGLLAVAFVYYITEVINKISERKYDYVFFDESSAVTVIIGYYLCFFGYNNLMHALRVDGDTLNGILLIGIGAIFLIVQLWKNFENTNFKMGLWFSIIQFAIYIPVAIIALFFIIVMIVIAADSRAAFCIND
jgi:CDP-diglyceride synthetase